MRSSRMIDGLGNSWETVRIKPRPFRIKEALLVIINPIARRVGQMFSGSKFAFRTMDV